MIQRSLTSDLQAVYNAVHPVRLPRVPLIGDYQ